MNAALAWFDFAGFVGGEGHAADHVINNDIVVLIAASFGLPSTQTTRNIYVY
ncbi:MAG: hypothetical protein M1113_01765 [Candidatus Thermoplasmatota archaeon]|nr:hypothetical protein [Candidatus Thermoplasmatota archaeon]